MITIHPAPGRGMSDLARTLIALAADLGEEVRSATSGITVSDEVALVYLTELLDPITDDQEPAPPALVPERLAEVVRSAETRAGVTRPLPDDTPQPARAPRKRAGPLARTKEPSNG